MKFNTRALGLFFLVILLLPCSIAFGHKLYVFAYEDNGRIVVEGKFTSGRPTIGAKVEVVDKNNGQLFLTGTTEKDGTLQFPIPVEATDNRAYLNIILDVGEGHRGVWTLNPEDYIFSSDSVDSVQASSPTESHSHEAESSFESPPSSAELEKTIRKVVSQELAPIKRALAENKTKKVNFQDILGGLGYIFGIAGIVAYIQSRKKTGVGNS